MKERKLKIKNLMDVLLDLRQLIINLKLSKALQIKIDVQHYILEFLKEPILQEKRDQLLIMNLTN